MNLIQHCKVFFRRGIQVPDGVKPTDAVNKRQLDAVSGGGGGGALPENVVTADNFITVAEAQSYLSISKTMLALQPVLDSKASASDVNMIIGDRELVGRFELDTKLSQKTSPEDVQALIAAALGQ